MGSKGVKTNSKFPLHVKWKSWPEFGKVNEIKLLSYGKEILSFNPNNYGGSKTLEIDLIDDRLHPLRMSAITDAGNQGFTNPIWFQTG